ncbi:MAG: hypothetical protein ACXVLQ_03145 [Bacteriovorax sp.]
MKKILVLLQGCLLITLFSCSHTKTQNAVSIASATTGLMKNHIAPFPVYLTDTLEDRSALEKKYTSGLYIIHTGHILKPNLSKDENEKTLSSLKGLGINLVNLTLEDFVIAESQGINFENYDVTFLNSSVIDLNLDSLATGKNIVPYDAHEGIAFIGLSDSKLDKKLSKEKYLISDYVLSILKVKKEALKAASPAPVNSFIIVHTLGPEINEVMGRLPPSFINSLAD